MLLGKRLHTRVWQQHTQQQVVSSGSPPTEQKMLFCFCGCAQKYNELICHLAWLNGCSAWCCCRILGCPAPNQAASAEQTQRCTMR
jgi:hypothetical protein